MSVIKDSTCGPDTPEELASLGLTEPPAFIYRMAAGASDASNMKPGGRCVVEGGFTRREDDLGAMVGGGTGSLLPAGILPHHFAGGNWGAELPNHACDTWPSDADGTCRGIIGYNGVRAHVLEFAHSLTHKVSLRSRMPRSAVMLVQTCCGSERTAR